MKYFYIVIGVCILYAAVVLVRFGYKVTHRPALPMVVQKDAVFGVGSSLRYIAAGDSTAVGEGASSVETTYPYLLLSELSKNNTVTYKNVGVSGAKTQDVIDKQLEHIISFNPDVVTLSVGANDSTHLWSRKTTLTNIQKIIADITSNTHATVYVAVVPNFKGGWLLPWAYIQLLEFRNNGLNKSITALESERVKIVNVHDFGWEKFSSMRDIYAADGFHPNDAGYQNWANAFLSRIQE